MRTWITFEFFLAWVSLFLGARILFRQWGGVLRVGWGISRQRRLLQKVFQSLQEIEETLGAGALPAPERWESLQSLAAPWGNLAYSSLTELRACGGALLPTLKRLRALAAEQIRSLAEARARSSQAIAQAAGCVFLIPIFGLILFFLLPGVGDFPWTWGALCGLSLFLSGIGAFWMVSMAENARWAGLPRASRGWILASQCAGERFLALVRAGTPVDLSWVRACELLAQEAPGLALAWGSSIWKAPPRALEGISKDPATLLLIEAGDPIRKAVQLSLMEGRPCAERVEAVLSSLSHDIRSRVEAELSLLSTRALKPLFLFVAPAVFLLLGVGLFLCFRSVVESG